MIDDRHPLGTNHGSVRNPSALLIFNIIPSNSNGEFIIFYYIYIIVRVIHQSFSRIAHRHQRRANGGCIICGPLQLTSQEPRTTMIRNLAGNLSVRQGDEETQKKRKIRKKSFSGRSGPNGPTDASLGFEKCIISSIKILKRFNHNNPPLKESAQQK